MCFSGLSVSKMLMDSNGSDEISEIVILLKEQRDSYKKIVL